MANHVFTSESVTEGHPDKVCDQISDAVLDDILSKDKMARVACETVVTTGMILVMGEISTDCYVDIPSIARETIRDIGYSKPEYGFDYASCAVLTSIDEQSPDIAMGVNRSYEAQTGTSTDADDEMGAGDQGMVFGYACTETPELMPAPVVYAHRLCQALAQARKNGDLSWLRPDGKAQVTVEYDEMGNAIACPAIVVSTQHDPDIEIKALREAVTDAIILPNIPKELIKPYTKIYVNPTGRFVTGGPVGDSGLTGRKIIVDTYGGHGGHGGGAFSGKDPTKVDRSGSYMARYVAKNIVAAGLAKRCQLEIAYAIGVAHPVSVFVDTYGTGTIPDTEITKLIQAHFDLRPGKIISHLGLRNPIYKQTAAYGHFGRPDLDLPWERLDMVEALRQA